MPSPNLSPRCLQLLWALKALWRLPGDVPKAQSEVGGVVGGVIGSFADGDPVLPVSSESPVGSTASPDEDPDRWAWSLLVHEMLRRGRNPTLGDLTDSSMLETEDPSLCMRWRSLGSLASPSSISSGEGAATDAIKGPRTESFMSSYTIVTASSSSEGWGGYGVEGSDRRRSRTWAGRLTSR